MSCSAVLVAIFPFLAEISYQKCAKQGTRAENSVFVAIIDFKLL
jgi:hypothetical protein